MEGYKYPLIYISTFETFPKRCTIVQVNDEFNDISVVGTINLPNDWTTIGDVVVDAENDKWYLMDIGLTSGSTSWGQSTLKLYEFNSIPTSGDSSINISTARIIVETPISLPWIQGSIFHNGDLWICTGQGNEQYPARLNVFNIKENVSKCTHSVLLQIGEPEDVDILDSKVIIGGAGTKPKYYLLDFGS